jgi:uncharacterized membrane protein (Fun14 family)
MSEPMNKLNEFLDQTQLPLHSIQFYTSLLGIGVAVGFLSKKYLRFMITAALVSLLVIKGLECQGMLDVDWLKITTTLGIQSKVSLEQWASELYQIGTDNAYCSITLAIGFLIGYQAG